MKDLDPVVMFPIDSLASWVKERERLLIEAEDEMFRAARDAAQTPEERAYFQGWLDLRAENARKQAK
jgi:hypothetical protein